MSLRLHKHLFSIILLFSALGLQSVLVGAGIQRPFDPVVIKGSQMTDFLGANANDLYVYAFKDGSWRQIPFQIDEIDSVIQVEGYTYFAPHNGVLDPRDELCFMAVDMGDSVADNSWINNIGSMLYQRYQVSARDTSVVPARKSYAYVYRSATISTVYSPYMSYKTGTIGRSDTVHAQSYIYGQNGDEIPDFLSIKTGSVRGPDILDRWKIRFKGHIGPSWSPDYVESEESALIDSMLTVRVGPVRILHKRTYKIIWQGIDIDRTLSLYSIFYPWSYYLDISDETLGGYLGLNELRQSVDYLPNVSGSLFHWSKGTNITVNGVPDPIADSLFQVPDFNWYMLQGNWGTAVTVFRVEPILGTAQSLYYNDNSSTAEGALRDGIGDTGDLMAYGESGVQLTALEPSYYPIDISGEDLTATFYYLPGYHSAAFGDSLANYNRHPLQVVVMPRTNTVIPVEMAAFKAQVKKGAVHLDWTTLTESNNYGFDIERKDASEQIWDKIGFVKGFGTSQTAHSYRYVDLEPRTGTNYYRLRQIDLDGRASYSEEIKITIQLPDKLELGQNYPNPFNPETEISFQIPAGSQQYVTLAIYNLLGQKLKTLVAEQLEPGSYRMHWDGRDELGQNVVSGAYIYRLQWGEQVLTRKMIKMQ